MDILRMKVSKCPSEDQSKTNRVFVNPKDLDPVTCPHLDISTGPGQHFVFTTDQDPRVAPGTVAFSMPQRKWATLSLNQEIDVAPYRFTPEKNYLTRLVLEVDFYNKKPPATDQYNSDDMAREFSMLFPKHAFTVGQQCVFSFQDKKLLQVGGHFYKGYR